MILETGRLHASWMSALIALYAVSPATAVARMVECETRIGLRPAVAGVSIADQQSDLEGFDLIRVRARNGAFLNVYYDRASRDHALTYASCLGSQLNLLQKELRDERANAQWFSLAFTADPDSVPRAKPGEKPVWIANTHPEAQRASSPVPFIVKTLSHEQVHSFQARNNTVFPLWFAEGHASWTGLRIARMMNADLAIAERERIAARARTQEFPEDLRTWGMRRPKRTAILRQVSNEDRRRMNSDPSYMPPGPFTFTPDDFESDETNMSAKYEASLRIFEALERRYGTEKTNDWVVAMLALAGRVSDADVLAAAIDIFGQDIEPLLSASTSE